MRMKHEPIAVGKRRPTNVSLPADAVAEAKMRGINVSKACEAGLMAQLDTVRIEQWKRDNQAWIDAHRAWVEDNPLPLERYRLF